MNNKKLLENLRCVPDFPIKGIMFQDVSTLFKNAECVKIMRDEIVDLYRDKSITKLVGIESRGFVMSCRIRCRHSAVPKARKTPRRDHSAVIRKGIRNRRNRDS